MSILFRRYKFSGKSLRRPGRSGSRTKLGGRFNFRMNGPVVTLCHPFLRWGSRTREVSSWRWDGEGESLTNQGRDRECRQDESVYHIGWRYGEHNAPIPRYIHGTSSTREGMWLESRMKRWHRLFSGSIPSVHTLSHILKCTNVRGDSVSGSFIANRSIVKLRSRPRSILASRLISLWMLAQHSRSASGQTPSKLLTV